MKEEDWIFLNQKKLSQLNELWTGYLSQYKGIRKTNFGKIRIENGIGQELS